jgi:hypothetical protein
MYRFDTATNNVSEVSLTGLTPWRPGYAQAYNSGAAVCGGNYFAVWTDIEQAQFGIAKVAFTAPNAGAYSQTMFPPGEPGSFSDVYHKLWCDPADSTKLFVVLSTPGQGQARASFSLQHYDIATGNTTKLFDYPDHGTWAATDDTFDYDPAQGKFWATWVVNKPQGHPFEKLSFIDMVQLGPGYKVAPAQTWSVPGKGGFLYQVFATVGAGTEEHQLSATLNHGKLAGDVQGLQWADLVLNDDQSVKLTPGVTVQDNFYTGGQTIATCGGLLWSVPEGRGLSVILGINPASPDKVEITIDRTKDQSGFWVGAVAC